MCCFGFLLIETFTFIFSVSAPGRGREVELHSRVLGGYLHSGDSLLRFPDLHSESGLLSYFFKAAWQKAVSDAWLACQEEPLLLFC